MKILKFLGKAIATIAILLLVFIVFTIAPVDRTDYQSMDYYKKMQEVVQQSKVQQMKGVLRVNWTVQNLTPTLPTPTAGYGDRKGKHYQSVHDSVFVRAIVLDNGQRHAIVACDLLIIPPEVMIVLQEKLRKINFNPSQLYIASTHTHNSVGAWGKNTVGELFAGKYDQATVNHVADCIVKAIQKAQQNLVEAEVGFSEINANEFVFNRLVREKGTTDPFLRVLKFKKTTGETALLCTYAAHATTLNADKNFLSADYTGAMIAELQKSKTADFAMFMAGAVGSMGPIGEENKDDFAQMKNMAEGLSAKITKTSPQILLKKEENMVAFSFQIPLRDPQVRFAENWRFRPWVFHKMFGDYPAEMKVLRLGNTILIGTPCDFSGELMAELNTFAKSKGLNLIITSFNGSYIGYITKDNHYDLNSYETRTMNWYGPQNGIYFQEIIKRIIEKVERDNGT
jgi:neutral ceramidase